MASTASGRLYACVATPLSGYRVSSPLQSIVLAVLLLALAPVAHGAEPPAISISSVSGFFLPNVENSGPFNSTPTTPVAFTQEFPVINFNPPVGTVPCTNNTGVDITTRPFTNVVPQPDGSCKTLPAQGKNQQAGVGELTNFQAVFTGAFVITSASRVTFNFFSDDGWILSLGPSAGAQPVYASGPMLNFPKAGPFTGFTVVGSYNVVSAATQNNLVVSFPAAGTYPFELDYSDCCEGQLAFTLTANGFPIPATTALTLDIRGIANAAQVQGVQHFEAVVASGQAQQVELLVDDRSRAVVKTPPFAFDWDTRLETPGKHKVVVRGTDASGGIADKELTLDVVAAAAAAPTFGPTPVATTTPPKATTQEGNPFAPLLVVGAITLVLIVAVGCFFLIRGSRETPASAPEPVLVATAPPVADSTEFIGKEQLLDLTAVSVRRPQLVPKAKLMLKPDREILLSRAAPTIIGRDASLAAAVEDRQVSRHHAKITCEGEEFWIEDLNSTNGTRVNGVPIERQKLVNNDQIGLGDAIVTFSIEPN